MSDKYKPEHIGNGNWRMPSFDADGGYAGSSIVPYRPNDRNVGRKGYEFHPGLGVWVKSNTPTCEC